MNVACFFYIIICMGKPSTLIASFTVPAAEICWATVTRRTLLLRCQASSSSRLLWTTRRSVSTASPSEQWTRAFRRSPPPRPWRWRWATSTTSRLYSARASTTPVWPRTETRERQWSGSLPPTGTQVTVNRVNSTRLCFNVRWKRNELNEMSKVLHVRHAVACTHTHSKVGRSPLLVTLLSWVHCVFIVFHGQLRVFKVQQIRKYNMHEKGPGGSVRVSVTSWGYCAWLWRLTSFPDVQSCLFMSYNITLVHCTPDFKQILSGFTTLATFMTSSLDKNKSNPVQKSKNKRFAIKI